MTITDAMVEAALNAYWPKNWTKFTELDRNSMRAAIEAVCGEIMRENEALRASCERYSETVASLLIRVEKSERENEALRDQVRGLKNLDEKYGTA